MSGNSEDLPDKPLIQVKDELKQYIHSVRSATLVDFKLIEVDTRVFKEDKFTNCFQFKFDLWKHAGYPGGEANKYICRIILQIEETGFPIIMATYF